ncbi:MAG: zinc ribbon domain-containing protein [Verrucomicrobiota bacterium]
MHCPHCGAELSPNAKSCRECGTDASTEWSEEAGEGLGLPDEEFDYEDFVRKEFGKSPVPRGLRPFWWIVGVLVLAMMLWLWVRGWR